MNSIIDFALNQNDVGKPYEDEPFRCESALERVECMVSFYFVSFTDCEAKSEEN